MLPFERKQKIIEILKSKKNMSVEDLSEYLFSSPATIRRDLTELSEEGLIRRIRGGAAYIDKKAVDLPYDFRKVSESDKKKHIAKLALDFISHDMTLFMDSSTTVIQMIPFLKEFRGLKILTNGTLTAHLLSQNTDAEITCVGGKVHSRSSSVNGAVACDFISSYYADLALLSAKSLTEFGAMEFTEDEAMVRKTYVKHSKEVVLLVDSTKFEVSSFYLSIPFSDIDTIISDAPLTPLLQKKIYELEMDFIY
ncbi:DeoR/GlpR family DNA-binding transcription regulator [Alkalibacter mobilis]|uniref:DeoR/GlpR family DNA-binding transcription regulator n=1 Tax=Alkalibacter mobilis TaxID=2787712 RepID=UPI0018A11BAE|nr:DeoR/GlpR family DNA-binding transcription regulator [Alkalibacter mobilis]MBF7097368.1 DeoR/GlpR transcriptional regulator [Alkalibacter mobilis]